MEKLGPSWPSSSFVSLDGMNPCMVVLLVVYYGTPHFLGRFFIGFIEHMRAPRNLAGYEPNIVGEDGTYVRSW